MGFNRDRVIELVREFYRSHGAHEGTRYVVVSNLDDALRQAVVHGPDVRLTDASRRRAPTAIQDLDDDRHVASGVHDLVFSHAVRREAAGRRFRTGEVFVLSADAAARLRGGGLRAACQDGLGWIIAADHTAIIVPSPIVRFAEGRPRVLHDDTGRMAVVWPDGHGYYFLHGTEFEKRLYFQVIDHQLLIQDIAALDNADQRAVALQYLRAVPSVIYVDGCGVRPSTYWDLPKRCPVSHAPREDITRSQNAIVRWIRPSWDLAVRAIRAACDARSHNVAS